MIYASESFYETTLASAITAAATSIPVTTAPTLTSGFLVIEANTTNREIIKYTGITGTTLTGCVRGLAIYGSDQSAGTGKAHAAGVNIACKDVHYYFTQYYDFLVGTSASGYNTMRVGDGAAISSSDRFWYIQTSSVSAFWGLSSSGQLVMSEDGITSYVISAGGSGVTAGDGIAITAGVVAVDRLSTGGLRISGGNLAINYGHGLSCTSANEFYVDPTHNFTWSGAHVFNTSSTFAASASFRASATFESGVTFNGKVTGNIEQPTNGNFFLVYPTYSKTSASDSFQLPANEVHLFPIDLPHAIDLNKISVYLHEGHGANRYAGAGIYSYDGLTRHAYWVEQISAGTPGVFSISVIGAPITLSAGAYLMGITTNNTSLRFRYNDLYNTHLENPLLMNSTNTKWGYAAIASNAGVLPISTGAITAYNTSASFATTFILT